MKRLKAIKVIGQNMLLFTVCAIMFQLSCKNGQPNKGPITNFNDWQMNEEYNDVRIYYNDISWAFVHRFFNRLSRKQDSTVIGPFRGERPDSDRVEYFNDDTSDPNEEKLEDNRWVVEYLSDEGCEIIVIGIRNGRVAILSNYVLKNRNCSSYTYDKDLKYKTLIGKSNLGDSIDVLALNYNDGQLIGHKKIKEDDYVDLEIIKGHLVKIKEEDSVYIDVVLSTDIETRYAYPGKFVRAKENADGCKVIVIKNGNGFQSYVLCPKIPTNKISTGTFTYGDSLSDLQSHYVRDTSRYVIGTYDSINNITRVDVIDDNATRIGQFEDYGKHVKTAIICQATVKFFVLHDKSSGENLIRFNAININGGNNRIANPASILGEFIGITASQNSCSVTIKYKDPQGTNREQLVTVQ